jgi:hypothetical protein
VGPISEEEGLRCRPGCPPRPTAREPVVTGSAIQAFPRFVPVSPAGVGVTADEVVAFHAVNPVVTPETSNHVVPGCPGEVVVSRSPHEEADPIHDVGVSLGLVVSYRALGVVRAIKPRSLPRFFPKDPAAFCMQG